MNKFIGYRCSLCATEYGPVEVTYTCPKDGRNLDGVLDLEVLRTKYQPSDIASRSETSLWRYLPLLPVSEIPGGATPLHAAGGTPVFSLRRIAEGLGISQLWLKDESRNPTASFKDRASAVVVARAREIHAEVIVTASTGNAGAALAGMAAAVGQKAVVLAPAVLGDMLELGSFADEAHRGLVRWMSGLPVDIFIAVGPLMSSVASEFSGKVYTFQNSLEARDSSGASVKKEIPF